jgi:hypothetical protein
LGTQLPFSIGDPKLLNLPINGWFLDVFTPDFGKKSHKVPGLALHFQLKVPSIFQLRWSVSALIVEALAMWLCAAW